MAKPKRTLTQIDVRANRHALDSAIAALERILDELSFELDELQKDCTHPDQDSVVDDGVLTHFCPDCGHSWVDRRK